MNASEVLHTATTKASAISATVAESGLVASGVMMRCWSTAVLNTLASAAPMTTKTATSRKSFAPRCRAASRRRAKVGLEIGFEVVERGEGRDVAAAGLGAFQA